MTFNKINMAAVIIVTPCTFMVSSRLVSHCAVNFGLLYCMIGVLFDSAQTIAFPKIEKQHPFSEQLQFDQCHRVMLD